MKNLITRNNTGLGDIFFNDFFNTSTKNNMMNTDIKQTEDGYEFKIDIPSVKKEDIKLSLEDGYLNVEASYNSSNDEEKNDYIRKERYCGSFSRSFYVGDGIKEEDIKAKLNDGVLYLDVKKCVEEPSKKYISIE